MSVDYEPNTGLYDDYGNELGDHELPAAYDTYFAGTDDEHRADGETEPEYAGPSIGEIQQAFDRLTPKQQYVLSRRLGLAGDRIRYSQEEIAQAMGIDVRNVQLLEANARRSLRANVVGLDARLAA